jgi:hypothetical protein
LVANFVTAYVGLLDSVALIGPLRQSVLSVDVLARSTVAGGGELVPMEVADALIKGAYPNVPPCSMRGHLGAAP